MSNIFISHSKRDKDLVTAMSKVLINIGLIPIIEEFIPEEEKEAIPYEEIRKNVNSSSIIFLFLTDNIVKTEYTRNWVMFEVGIAANSNKKLFVFERTGVPVPYPIPYLTDYMIFNINSTNDVLEIQTLSKKLKKLSTTLKGTLIGSGIGLFFGPLGILIGSIAGGLLGASVSNKTLKVQCDNCGVSFNYFSPQITKFSCPSCRKNMNLY